MATAPHPAWEQEAKENKRTDWHARDAKGQKQHLRVEGQLSHALVLYFSSVDWNKKCNNLFLKTQTSA